MTPAKMTKRFDARFDEQTIRKLSALAKQTGLTRSEVVRLLVFQARLEQFKTGS